MGNIALLIVTNISVPLHLWSHFSIGCSLYQQTVNTGSLLMKELGVTILVGCYLPTIFLSSKKSSCRKFCPQEPTTENSASAGAVEVVFQCCTRKRYVVQTQGQNH